MVLLEPQPTRIAAFSFHALHLVDKRQIYFFNTPAAMSEGGGQQQK